MPDKKQAGEPVKINKDGHIEPTNDGQIEINKDIAGDRLKPTDELAPLFEGESIESILLRKHLILKLQDNKITEIDREDAIYLAMHEHSAPYIKRCAELDEKLANRKASHSDLAELYRNLQLKIESLNQQLQAEKERAGKLETLLSNQIKEHVRSLDVPDNKIYHDNELLILSCFGKSLEFIEQAFATSQSNEKGGGR